MAEKVRDRRALVPSGPVAAVAGGSFFDVVSGLAVGAEVAAGPHVGRGSGLDENIRLTVRPTLSYPADEVASVARAPSQRARESCYVVETSLPGIVGAGSPLPASYLAETARNQLEPGGRRICAVLDIFNHRMLVQLFRTWSKYLLLHGEDRTRLLGVIASLSGRPGPGANDDRPLGELQIVAAREVTAHGLEALYLAQTGRRIRIHAFRRRSYAVGVGERTSLPKVVPPRLEDRPPRQVLGSGWLVGSRVSERSGIDVEMLDAIAPAAAEEAKSALTAMLEESALGPSAPRWIRPESQRWRVGVERPRAIGRDAVL